MRTHNQANIEQNPEINSLVRPSPFRRSVAWITLIAYIGQPMLASAQVIANQAAAANNRPTVDVTANGLPLVQIVTPNAAGLSHNQYTQFNVGPEGVILNNSTTAVQTQQAGYVSANPNLKDTSARIILNEVNGTSRSQLNGYTEVAGQQAEVIIANPNGITCNGCGFINTSRGVLTTGTPVIGSGGSLDYFRVTGGDIQIGSAGMNAGNISQLDLIARSVQVNGQLWANNLNVITGTNQVDYNTLGVQIIAGDANKPTVGIDVALLGGMYANKIHLVGTEAGVGVRSFGNLAAQAGDFTLNNAGLITLGGKTTASGNLTVAGVDINSTGTLAAGVDSNGNTTANGNLTLKADKRIDTTGSNAQNSGGAVSLTASIINLAGSNSQALTDLTLTATAGDIDLSGAKLYSLGKLSATTSAAINNNKGNITADSISLSAGSFSNTSGYLLQTGTGIATFNITGALDNTAGEINSNDALSISANSVSNQGGKFLSVGNMDMTTASLIGIGSILGGGDVSIKGLQGDYTNQTGNVIGANGNLTLDVGGNFTNQADLEVLKTLTIKAGGNILNDVTTSATPVEAVMNSANTTLQTTSGDITNNGSIYGTEINTGSNNFYNNYKIIGGIVNLTANNLYNTTSASVIGATNTLNLWVAQQLHNTNGAQLLSLGDINIAKDSTLDANGNFINPTLHILNENSSIQAGSAGGQTGNINIAAVKLDNIRPVSVTHTLSTPVIQTLTAPNCTSVSINCSPHDGHVTVATPPTQANFFDQDISGITSTTFIVNGVDPITGKTNAQVFFDSKSAGKQGYQLSSSYVDWFTNSTITTTTLIDAANVKSVQSVQTVEPFTGNLVNKINVTMLNGAVQTFDTLDKQGTYYSVSYYPGYDPSVNIHPSKLTTMGGANTTMYEISRVQSTTTVTDSYATPIKPAATILASGNINLNIVNQGGATGTINNENSIIAAAKNLTISGSTTAPLVNGGSANAVNAQLNNTATLLEQVATTSNNVTYSGWWFKSSSTFNFNNSGAWYDDTGTKTLTDPAQHTPLPSLSSLVTAGGAVNLTGTSINNQNTSGAGAVSGSTTGTTLPSSSLYTFHPQPGQNYLVVTDPHFANYQNFISSDYMLNRLSLDPALIQKRLGDGYYEQQLVSDQITELSGRRNLGHYASAEEQFKALMDSGVAVAQAFKLVPGLELTKEQIASLTSDIVWMINKKVTLSDGSSTTVLAPQVYLSRVHTADLQPNGALISGSEINIANSDTVANSGTLHGTVSTQIQAQNVTNKLGTISSGGLVKIQAANDILNQSGSIKGNAVDLHAGHDIVNTSLTETTKVGNDRLNASTTQAVNTGSIIAAGDLTMSAANDISITGARVAAGGDAAINAGNKLTVGTIQTGSTSHSSVGFSYDANDTTYLGSTVVTGGKLDMSGKSDVTLTSAQLQTGGDTTIRSGGNLTINAAKNVSTEKYFAGGGDNYYASNKLDETVLGSSLNAGGNVTLVASRLNTDATSQPAGSVNNDSNTARTDGKGNITLQSAAITSNTGKLTVAADANIDIGITKEEHTTYSERHSKSSGTFKTTTRTTRDETWRTDTIGSSLSGDSVTITSGKDINITGSSASAEHDIKVAALGDVNIAASTDTYGSDHYSHEITNGWQAKNAFSITNHGPETTNKARTDGTNQSFNRSSLNSKEGNLSILSGGNLISSGTDLAADKGDLALTAGGTVALLAGQDTLNQSSSSKTVTQDNIFTKQRHTITDTYASLDYQGSTLNGKSVKIKSGVDTILQATSVTAGEGGITIDAGGDIKLLAATNQSSHTHTETLATDGYTFRADGSLNDTDTRRMNNKHEEQKQTNQVASLISGGNITTHSGGDTLIEASNLDAQGSIDLSATGYAGGTYADGTKYEGRKGTVTFAAIKDSNYINEVNSSNSMPWQSSSGHGEMVETIKLANIKAGKGLTVDAKGGIIVDIPEVPKEAPAPVEAVVTEEPIPTFGPDGNPLTEEQKAALIAERKAKAAEKAAQAAKYAAEKPLRDEKRFNDLIQSLAGKPGQEWIGQLAKLAKEKPDSVKLQQVNAALEKWDYAHDGLTTEAMVVIAIVVTYFTAGAGSSAVGTTTTTAAGSTTTLGGTTLATTTTTAAGATVTTYTVAGAVINAGFSALVSQAAVSFLNNKGNVGKTLDDMGKSENVKATIAAMLTAGISQNLAGTEYMKGLNASANAPLSANSIVSKFELSFANTTVNTAVNSAVYGTSFTDALGTNLKNAGIDVISALTANAIGASYKTEGGWLNDQYVLHKLTHAALGCASASAKGQDCGSGALGGVTGEVFAQLIGGTGDGSQLSPEKQGSVAFYTQLATAGVATLSGAELNTALATSQNAVQNNYLSHKENQDRLDAAKACANGDAAACDRRDALNALDQIRNVDLNQACQGNRNSADCITATVDMRKQLDTYFQADNNVQYTDNKKLSIEDQKAGLGSYTAKNELQTYVDLLKVSNQQTEAVQSYDKPAKSPVTYNSDPYGVMNPENPDLYMVVKAGDQWGVVGKSDKVYTSVAGVNGILNKTDYAPGLMGVHVENKYETSSLYTLYYNPTNGFLSDGWETFMDKLSFTTPVTKQFSGVLSGVQASGNDVSWIAHSQGGAIFAEAVRFNGGNLSRNSVAFDSGANNEWVTNYYLQKAGINSGIETKYNDSPIDFVPNVIGLNGNPFKMMGSTIAIPLLFMGPAVSPHTLPPKPAQPSAFARELTQ